MLRKELGSLPPFARKERPLFPNWQPEPCSSPPKPFPNASGFCFDLVLATGGLGCGNGSATSASSPSASGSAPGCGGLKQASLVAGLAAFTPFFSFLLKCPLFLPTLLTANEPHQAIKSWSKMKDEKEGQLEFQLLLLLFSFEQVRRLCNRQRYRQ